MPSHSEEAPKDQLQPLPPTNFLTTPTGSDNIGVAMPASGSITKEQLERDIIRTRKEIERLKVQEAALLGTLKMYFPEAAKEFTAPQVLSFDLGVEERSLESYSIAEASVVIFRDLSNQWLSLADLDTELRRRGKVCSKGSIELMLKAAPEKFERTTPNSSRSTARTTAMLPAPNAVTALAKCWIRLPNPSLATQTRPESVPRTSSGKTSPCGRLFAG
ncbi:MAG: hypothetical protein ABSH50_13460 [Bryobacteraceae bacterium]